MNLDEYDEQRIYAQLAQLDHSAKTMFASACAEVMWPLFERYAAAASVPLEATASLRQALDAVWGASTEQTESVVEARALAEAMVPGDGGDWVFESGYGQNAAAAVAYAARTWITNDPQEATWAARQVFEAADLAAQQERQHTEFNPEVEAQIKNSVAVRWSVSTIHTFLDTVGQLESHSFRNRARELAGFTRTNFP